jgi:hypothetical protein
VCVCVCVSACLPLEQSERLRWLIMTINKYSQQKAGRFNHWTLIPPQTHVHRHTHSKTHVYFTYNSKSTAGYEQHSLCLNNKCCLSLGCNQIIIGRCSNWVTDTTIHKQMLYKYTVYRTTNMLNGTIQHACTASWLNSNHLMFIMSIYLHISAMHSSSPQALSCYPNFLINDSLRTEKPGVCTPWPISDVYYMY